MNELNSQSDFGGNEDECSTAGDLVVEKTIEHGVEDSDSVYACGLEERSSESPVNVVDLCPPPTDKETIEPMVGEVNLCPSLTDKKKKLNQ